MLNKDGLHQGRFLFNIGSQIVNIIVIELCI